MDKIDLWLLAIEYRKANEPELAIICEKSALHLDQKEKRHTKECSA